MADKALMVVGQRRFVQTMRKAGADMDDLKEVNREAAQIALPAVRNLAPRGKTGRLAGSLRVGATKRAGVIRAACERGLVVPRDISVCGFDDTPIARHIYPALTTVRQPTSDMGRLATMQLLARIRAADAGGMVHVEHEVLFRESTQPPVRH